MNETAVEDDARDAARCRWMRRAHLSGERFVARIGHKQPNNGILWTGVYSEEEYDRAVDEQMSGVVPVTMRIA